MKHSFLSRLIAAGLCLGLSLSSAGAALIDGGFTYSYRIGLGTTYSRTEGMNSAGMQRANAIEYTPSSDVSPIGARAGTQFYGNKKTLSKAAAALEAQGYDVLGGINADFFSTENGIPTGLVVDNGRIIACNTWQNAVGFRADGSAVIGQPVTSITVSGASGKVGVYGYNKTRTSVGLYLLDSYYYSQTRFSTPGQSIILQYQDKNDLRIGHEAKFTVVGKNDGSSSFEIGEYQMVLTKRSDCTAAWIDYPIGEEVTITFNTMQSGWDEVKYAVGGKCLVTNGQSTPTSIDRGTSHCARTAVGAKADGTVVLFEVDGESSYSRGMTANELAAEMIARGCVSAVCLDGGGSSTMTVQEPGVSSTSRISRPNGGSSERAVSNFIFLVNRKQSDSIPSYLYMSPVTRYVLPGASTTFSTIAVDDASVRTSLPGEVEYTVAGGVGTVSDDQFHAGSTTGPTTVYARSGSASGEMQLMVIGAVTSSSLSAGGKAVSSVSVKAEEKIDLDATVFYNGSTVASRDDLLNWSVTGGVGTIDQNGVFTGTKRGSGKIVLSYGSYSTSIPVTVGMGAPQALTTIADFETTQPVTTLGGVTLERVTDAASVARGVGALSVAVSGVGNLDLPETDVTGTPALSLWAKADGSISLYALYADENGDEIEAPVSGTPGAAYAFLTCAAPEGARYLTGLRAQGQGTLYLDHIQVSAAAPLSTGAPAITLTSAPETASAGSSVTVTARITQENDAYPVRTRNVRAYVNGKLSSAQYNEGTASISVPTGALGAGLHTVVIEASDDAGNRTRKAATIRVAGSTSSFADTTGHWAADYADRLAARGIMQGATSGGKTYYYPNNNLKRCEFAAIIARTLGLDTSSTEGLSFTDNDTIPAWARGSVAAVYRAGLMSGSSTGAFNPNADITRAEAMTVISRSLPRGYAPGSASYTDQSAIPSWALSHIRTVASIGLVGGYPDGSIRPNGKITRGEIAKIFCYL